jgi:hypothetical protein
MLGGALSPVRPARSVAQIARWRHVTAVPLIPALDDRPRVGSVQRRTLRQTAGTVFGRGLERG